MGNLYEYKYIVLSSVVTQGDRRKTVSEAGYGFDLPSSKNGDLEKKIFILVLRQSAAFSSATQHVMPSEFKEKWRTECLITRFLLHTLLYTGYSVMVKKNILFVPTVGDLCLSNYHSISIYLICIFIIWYLSCKDRKYQNEQD